MFEVKQSTALDILFFAHDVNGDAVTGIVDGGFTKNISKAAAAFGTMTVTITERAGGWYLLPLSTAHTDTLGVITIYLTSTAKQVNLQFRVAARIADDLAYPATSGRSMVVDAAGLVDANTVKLGATGAGTAQTARDLGLAIPAAVAGAAGGLLISGSNSGTTTLGALTITGVTTLTGNMVLSDGLTISAPSTAGRAGITVTGNAAGAGIISTGGATGNGLTLSAGATSGHGMISTATGTSFDGLRVVGSPTTGQGFRVIGGSTSGDGISITTTSGHGITSTATGSSKHGMILTGGNAGTSDGASLVAGTGGVDFRANQTGNLVGTVSTLTTYTGNTPQTGDAFLRLGAPAGASVSADVAAVKVDTAAVKTKTDFLPSATAGNAGGVFIAGSNAATTYASMTVTGALTISDGLLVSRSTVNTSAITATGNGTGSGVVFTSGSGTTGDGLRAVAASTNGSGITGVKTGTGSDLNATVTPLTLAKTTNITGFNDIAATAVVSAGAITTSAGKVSGVILTDTLTTYTGNTVQTGDSFARIGVAGAGLTNIDLPNQTMDIVGNITGNLSGSVGSVTGLTASNLDATITSRATSAQVKTEVVNALNVDTYAEPGQGAPAATTTLVAKLGFLYKAFRNRKRQTATLWELMNDAEAVVDQKATVSDDAVTAIKTKVISGP